MNIKRELKNVYQITRRRLLILFRPNYVRESISKRKGYCDGCINYDKSCCEANLFGKKWNCKHYNKKTRKCNVYNSCKMPLTCRYYPIDEKDIWDEFKDKCKFYWEDNTNKKR